MTLRGALIIYVLFRILYSRAHAILFIPLMLLLLDWGGEHLDIHFCSAGYARAHRDCHSLRRLEIDQNDRSHNVLLLCSLPGTSNRSGASVRSLQALVEEIAHHFGRDRGIQNFDLLASNAGLFR